MRVKGRIADIIMSYQFSKISRFNNQRSEKNQWSIGDHSAWASWPSVAGEGLGGGRVCQHPVQCWCGRSPVERSGGAGVPHSGHRSWGFSTTDSDFTDGNEGA